MTNTTNQNNEIRQNATENGTKIFVNLPVSDLKKTMNFFSNLGFTFNPIELGISLSINRYHLPCDRRIGAVNAEVQGVLTQLKETKNHKKLH